MGPSPQEARKSFTERRLPWLFGSLPDAGQGCSLPRGPQPVEVTVRPEGMNGRLLSPAVMNREAGLAGGEVGAWLRFGGFPGGRCQLSSLGSLCLRTGRAS